MSPRRPTVDVPRHGTYLGYSSDGCRCADCRAAKAAYERGRRGGNGEVAADPWGALAASCSSFLSAWEDERTDALVLGSIAAGLRECVDDISALWARRQVPAAPEQEQLEVEA